MESKMHIVHGRHPLGRIIWKLWIFWVTLSSRKRLLLPKIDRFAYTLPAKNSWIYIDVIVHVHSAYFASTVMKGRLSIPVLRWLIPYTWWKSDTLFIHCGSKVRHKKPQILDKKMRFDCIAKKRGVYRFYSFLWGLKMIINTFTVAAPHGL